MARLLPKGTERRRKKMNFRHTALVFLVYTLNSHLKRINKMKTIFVIVISAIVTIGSTVALAQSKVEKSIILNKSINKGNATVAIGEGNTATTGSVTIE